MKYFDLLKFFLFFWLVFLNQGCSCDCNCDDASSDTSRGALTAIREREVAKIPSSDLRDKFYKLLMTIDSGYNPPLWIPKHDLGRYLSATIVYYGFAIASAKELVYQREPCRINGDRKYNLQRMEINFKYSKSPINFKTIEMIGIYTLTPLKLSKGEFVDVKIFSMAWPHFEDSSLPEIGALKFIKSQHDRKIFLSDFFHQIFSKLLRCVSQNKIHKIVFGDLGIDDSIAVATNKFSLDYIGIMNEVFLIYFNAPFSDRILSVGNTHLSTGETFDGTLIDAILRTQDANELDVTLFVNSASAVALLGNGNGMENTTNGILGRISAISVLGWGVTNSKMSYEFVVPERDGDKFLNELD